jgi:3',5'-nucleoside bisphosphate phosphatase
VIELQSHSTFSDGELPPAGVVEAARDAGVTVLSLSDHDSVDGLAEAQAAADAAGIELVPAVEISCVHPLAEDLHVLGYRIDPDTIQPACARAQEERVWRAKEIVARLNERGVDVSFEDAAAQAGDASSIGRPHIARAAGATDMKSFFERYLVPGAEAFVARRWPSAFEAVDLIRNAGGVAVLAHPFWDLDDPQVVESLVMEAGFEGVECFYPSHDREQTRFLVELCGRLGLCRTASSDFHGPNHKTFPRFGAYHTFGLAEPDVPAAPRRA